MPTGSVQLYLCQSVTPQAAPNPSPLLPAQAKDIRLRLEQDARARLILRESLLWALLVTLVAVASLGHGSVTDMYNTNTVIRDMLEGDLEDVGVCVVHLGWLVLLTGERNGVRVAWWLHIPECAMCFTFGSAQTVVRAATLRQKLQIIHTVSPSHGNCLFVGWVLTSHHHTSVSQGWICSDDCTCCDTRIEIADQSFYFTLSQYTDTGPASPSADLITPGARQGQGQPFVHQFLNHWYDSTWKNAHCASENGTPDLPLSKRTT